MPSQMKQMEPLARGLEFNDVIKGLDEPPEAILASDLIE